MFQLLQLVASITVVILDGLFVRTHAYCGTSVSCDGASIEYPFYSPQEIIAHHCGYLDLGITCANEGRVRALNISNHLYIVKDIIYERKTLTVMDADIDTQECKKPKQNFSLQSSPSLHFFHEAYIQNMTIFYNCSSYPKGVVQKMSCLDDDYSNNATSLRSFAFYDDEIPKGFNWYGNCKENVVVPTASQAANFNEVYLGIQLKWYAPNNDCNDCERSGGECSFNTTNEAPACSCNDDIRVFGRVCPKVMPTRVKVMPTRVKVMLGVAAGVGGLLLILLVIYRRILYSLIIYRWRNKVRGPTNVDTFLESCGRLPVQRFRYLDIKKMTNSFKEALGKGGFGTVFKGKLRDGRLVAVKVLNESKGNGEDFINEVAAIGRTNHVNVVSLLGFCTDGTKRALVYEFMPNGSLEKFIYNEKNSTTTNPPLGWEKLYQIALGIARGLEYLHRGCNTRILHFDIKPHNILLDQNFCPKISDFGLAKLCQTTESVVSMVGARGTISYTAPEVCCRNFGGVSHKSDVYSYGMTVLEMIGGRKNIDTTVENISEIFFPQWIYNRIKRDILLEGPEDNKMEGAEEIFEDQTAKKMIIIALWCIQAHPTDRPSMSKVVNMLEGTIEELHMSPNPFPDPSSSSS